MTLNITHWLDQNADRFPDKPAFVEERRSISYKQLQNQAQTIAVKLLKKRLLKKPIAVFMEKGIDMILSFMGIAYSGNFYSPLDIDMPTERMDKILEVLSPALVITTPELKERFLDSKYRGEFLIFETDDEITATQREEVNMIGRKIINTDLLYVMFTSGSTGIPKGVAITHQSVIDLVDCVTETFDITEEDIFGNQAPFYFDMSVLDIYCSIKSGATNYIIPKYLFTQPVLLLNYLKENGINTISWVPSALIVVAKLKALYKVDLSHVLKRVMFCGEVMPNKYLNVWRKHLPNVLYVNLYGPTEATHSCTYYIVNRTFTDDEPLPIGIPMKNTDILVLTDKNELVSGNEIGELCIRGVSLSTGYYNDTERTNEVFIQNPLNQSTIELIYRTGDLVRYNEFGELLYLSRKDLQIKHLGNRIELGEIELAVFSLQEISLCCCVYDELRHKIVLFIDEDLDIAYINKQISKLLPKYMLPDRVIVLNKMPMNQNGKIDRAALKKMI